MILNRENHTYNKKQKIQNTLFTENTKKNTLRCRKCNNQAIQNTEEKEKN